MRIHFWCLLVVVVVLCVIGCRDGAQRLASRELYRLRNLGRLHASQGTAEGFERSYEQFQRVVEQSPADLRDRLSGCPAFFSSRPHG